MEQRSRHYENILIGLMFLTFGTIFLDRMAQFYLAPYIIPDLHLSNEQLGMMASVLGIAWALSCVFFGAMKSPYAGSGRRRSEDLSQRAPEAAGVMPLSDAPRCLVARSAPMPCCSIAILFRAELG